MFNYEDYFGERLQKLRDSKRVSARKMSLDIGQNSSYINQIENKKNFPTMENFFYICEYLNITPEEFFAKDKQNPEKLNDLINDLKGLKDEQLDILRKTVTEFKVANQVKNKSQK